MNLNIFSEELVSALGWSLLHSLWQGALIALILGVALLFLQKKSSNLRYTLSISAIVLTLFSFLGTFAYLYSEALAHSASYQRTILVFTQRPDSLGGYENIIATATENQGILAVFLDYFNHHLPIIVVVWLLGVLVLSLRFLGGIAYLQRLRHYQNQPLSRYWQEKMEDIARQVQVKKSVQLLESALIKVPMVVGYMKPLILLPIGTVNALSQAEVEAILAHELAHIRRHDYLVNLIQSIIDVLFFYHPAVWWMSSTVRGERENCCDDLALSVTGNSLIIAKALANLEAIRLSTPQLSLAFVGQKNQLLNRISRLLGQPMKKRNNFTEGIIAILIIIVFLTTINYNVNASSENGHEMTVTVQSDTTEPKAQKIIIKADDEEEVLEEYIIIEEAGEMPKPTMGLFVPNGVPIWSVRPTEPLSPKLATKPYFVLPDGGNEPLHLVAPDVNIKADNIFFSDNADVWSEIAHANIRLKAHTNNGMEWNDDGELNDVFPKGSIMELNAPALTVKPTAPNDLFAQGGVNFKFDANDFELATNVWVSPDTSILDYLDEADIVIIEGDKTIIIRKKDNGSAKLKRYYRDAARATTINGERAKRSSEIAIARAKRYKERAAKDYERQIKIIKRQKKDIEKRAKREAERAKRHAERRVKEVEKEVKRMKKRLEMREKTAEKRLEKEKERALEFEKRAIEREKEMVKRKAEMDKHNAEIEKRRAERIQRTNKLQAQMVKDGILKEGEEIKSLSINTKNDKTTIKVNGKKVPQDKVKGYMKILEKE